MRLPSFAILAALVAIARAGHEQAHGVKKRHAVDGVRVGRAIVQRASEGDAFAADLVKRVGRRQLPDVVDPLAIVTGVVANAGAAVSSVVDNVQSLAASSASVSSNSSSSANSTSASHSSTGRHSRTRSSAVRTTKSSSSRSKSSTSHSRPTKTTKTAKTTKTSKSKSKSASKATAAAAVVAATSSLSYSTTVLPNGKTSVVVVTPSAVFVTASPSAGGYSSNSFGTSTNVVVVQAGAAQADNGVQSVTGAAARLWRPSAIVLALALIAIVL